MTKKVRALLSGLPLLFLGSAAPDHSALGPLRFGSTEISADHAVSTLEQERRLQGKSDVITAEVLRKHFLYTGTRPGTPGKLAGKDNMLKLRIDYKCQPKLTEVSFRDRQVHPAGEWDMAIKETWELLRDVCESKFQRPPHAIPGEWPTMDSLPESGFTATDKWEYEGIKIELGIQAYPARSAVGDSSRAVVVLKATNTLTK